MKKMLIAITFLLPYLSQSQFIPLLDMNNSWSVDVYYEPFDPPDPPYFWVETEQISIGGIEVINSMDYYRIMMGDQGTCLLREENGIVYKYDVNDDIDRILFDFNLEVGDTFNLLESAYEDDMYCISIGSSLLESELNVQSVEELFIAGEMRKVITFEQVTNYSQIQWIEGIGNISGFDLIWELLDVTGGSLLVCFAINGNTYYFNGADSCDNTTLNIHETNKDSLVLYPNPVTNRSILHISEHLGIDHIKIYDITGKCILEDLINNHYYMIDAFQYPSGLYFYRVFQKGKLLRSDKFIVN
jgi:hypothetical protein